MKFFFLFFCLLVDNNIYDKFEVKARHTTIHKYLSGRLSRKTMQDDSSKESVVDNNKNNHKQLQLVTVIDKTNEERKNVENEKNQGMIFNHMFIFI